MMRVVVVDRNEDRRRVHKGRFQEVSGVLVEECDGRTGVASGQSAANKCGSVFDLAFVHWSDRNACNDIGKKVVVFFGGGPLPDVAKRYGFLFRGNGHVDHFVNPMSVSEAGQLVAWAREFQSNARAVLPQALRAASSLGVARRLHLLCEGYLAAVHDFGLAQDRTPCGGLGDAGRVDEGARVGGSGYDQSIARKDSAVRLRIPPSYWPTSADEAVAERDGSARLLAELHLSDASGCWTALNEDEEVGSFSEKGLSRVADLKTKLGLALKGEGAG